MNCSYIASQLVTRLYVIPTIGDIEMHLDPLSATCDASYLDAYDIEFKQTSNLNGRYQFSYELNFSLQGYNPFDDESYFFILQTKSGECFLINKEFSYLTHTFTLNNSECYTRITVEVEENMPVLPVTIDSEAPYSASGTCSYNGGGKTSLSLVNHDRSALNASGDVVSYDAVFLDDVTDSVSLTESYDGYIYSTTLQFVKPLSAVEQIGSYNLMEFQENKWSAIVKKDGLAYYAGWELGLYVTTTIDASNDDSTITVELKADENKGLLVNDDVVEIIDEQLEWRFIEKTPDGLWCWVCDGLEPNPTGNAQYILKCGYYKNGTFADRYLEQREFQGWYPEIQDKVEGTFNDVVIFYKDSCYVPDTLKIEGIVSPHKFNIVGQRRNIQINSKWSNWTATTVPSFVELSQERGTSGETMITMTCTGNTNTQGTLLIANAHQAQSFTIIADFTDAVIVQSTETDYRAKTITYWLRRPVYLYRKSSTSGFDASVAISGKWAKITYPENQTGQDVVYTFVFKETAYPHKEQTVVITQHAQGA